MADGHLGHVLLRSCGIDAGGQRLEVHLFGWTDKWIVNFLARSFGLMFHKHADSRRHIIKVLAGRSWYQNFTEANQRVIGFERWP